MNRHLESSQPAGSCCHNLHRFEPRILLADTAHFTIDTLASVHSISSLIYGGNGVDFYRADFRNYDRIVNARKFLVST
jgi:hypothetical protein